MEALTDRGNKALFILFHFLYLEYFEALKRWVVGFFKPNVLWIIPVCVHPESRTFLSLPQLKVLGIKNKLVLKEQQQLVDKSSLDQQQTKIYGSWVKDLFIYALSCRCYLDLS